MKGLKYLFCLILFNNLFKQWVNICKNYSRSLENHYIFQESAKLIFKSLEGRGTSNFFNNFSFTYKDVGKGYYQIDAYGDVFIQVEAGYVRKFLKFENLKFSNFQLQATLIFRAGKSEKLECSEKVYENRINICQVARAMKSNVLLEYVLAKMLKSISFELACPFKKGEYFIRNMTVSIPPMLPAPSGFYCFEVLIFGRTKAKKKMEPLVTVMGKVELMMW